MIKFNTFSSIIEKMSASAKKWIDIDLRKLDNETGEKIWNMYTTTYLPQGMYLSANDWKEMQHKYKASWLIDIDKDKEPDAFIIYKDTEYGHKMALIGSDNSKEGKSTLLKQVFSLLVKDKWYLEASMKMEDILSKSNIPAVTDASKIKKIIPGAENIKDGYYERSLSKVDKKIIKRIYGKPIV